MSHGASLTKVAIIVLAAGASRRFGTDDKLLALIEGEALVVRTVRPLSAVSLPECSIELAAVVQPGGAVAIALAQSGIPLRLVTNPRADEGMGTSIAAGITGLAPDVAAALIVPADMPMITADFARHLITAFISSGGDRPVHPVLADGSGVGPVVWPRAMFAALSTLTGELGGRSLLSGLDTVGVAIGDPDLLLDIDTPADLERVVGKLRR